MKLLILADDVKCLKDEFSSSNDFDKFIEIINNKIILASKLGKDSTNFTARDFDMIDNFNFIKYLEQNGNNLEEMFFEAGYTAAVRTFEFDLNWR